MEEWRDVVGYEGLYQVSNLGNLRSLHWYGGNNIKQLAKNVRPDGYLSVNLHKDGKPHPKTIHRLVAQAFIPQEEGKDFVNHKDENRANNCVENLEWCDKSYNQLYSMKLHPEREKIFTDNLRNKETGELGSRFTKKGIAHTNFERVKQCYKDGTCIAEYENATIAAKETGIDISCITNACKANARTDRVRKRKCLHSAKGYVWLYDNEVTERATRLFFVANKKAADALNSTP